MPTLPGDPQEPKAQEEAKAPAPAENFPFEPFVIPKKTKHPPTQGLLDLSFGKGINADRGRAMRVMRAGFESGVPEDIIDRNLEMIEKKIQQSGFNAERFRTSDPDLARMYAESPNWVAITKEDRGPLNDLTKIFYRKDDVRRPRTTKEIEAQANRFADRKAKAYLQKMTGDFAKSLRGGGFSSLPFDEKDARDAAYADYLKYLNAEEEFISSNDPVGLFEGIAKRYRENEAFFLPFVGGTADAVSAINIYTAAKAAESGTATEDQQDLLVRMARMEEAAQRRGTSFLGGVGGILAELPAFAGEFALTGGLYSAGKTVVLKGTREAVSKFVTRMASRTARKIVVGAEKMAARAVGSGLQTIATPHRILGGMIERMTPDGGLVSEDGNVYYHVQKGTGESFWAALPKAAFDQFVEIASERTGAAFAWADKPVAKVLFDSWAGKVPGRTAKGFQEALKKVGFNGVLGEIGEEEVAKVMRAMGGTIGLSDETSYSLPFTQGGTTGEEFLQQLVAFGIFPAAGSALNRAEQSFAKAQAEQEIIQSIGDSVMATQSAKDFPEAIAKLTEEATAGTNLASVVIDAKTFNQHMAGQVGENGEPLDPEEVAGNLFGDAAIQGYKEAVATGSDIVIPMSVYTSKIVPSKYRQFFQENVRLNPLNATAKESEEQVKKIIAEEEAKEAARAAVKPESQNVPTAEELADREREQGVKSVVERVQGFLEKTRFKKESKAMATFAGEVFGGLARMAGTTVENVLAQRPLTVEEAEERPSPDVAGRSIYQQGAPEVSESGQIELTHYASSQLDEINPQLHGTGPIGGAERRRKANNAGTGAFVDRSYFGIGVGGEGGYQKEAGLGSFRHTAKIDASKLYDFANDPAGLEAKAAELAESQGVDFTTAYEKAIKDAGFSGYWVRSDSLGMVGAVFESVRPESVVDESGQAPRIGAQDAKRESQPGREGDRERTPGATPGAEAGARPEPAGRGAGERSRQEADAGADSSKPAGLAGAPSSSPGPSARIRALAREYLRAADLPFLEQTRYVKVDPERSARIAQAFEEMVHQPENPEVAAAYQVMIAETIAQYQAIKKLGLTIEMIQPGQANPYPNGSSDLFADLESGHLWFFPTMSGFGTINEVRDNPMLAKTNEFVGDYQLLANDIFRIVHDVFGHAKEGVGFGVNGEENAWQSHVLMYSPAAAMAMTTETRGQNSWVNFGPHAANNQSNKEATIYADQKIGILPAWAMTEGLQEVRMFEQEAPRPGEVLGRMIIGKGLAAMKFFKNANRSTFFHEMGHLYLDTLISLANQNDATAQIKQQVQDVVEWLEVKSSSEIGDAEHEKFAQALERYLIDGHAPSRKLRKLFARIRQWLLQVYGTSKAIGVELNPHIVGVFDRMLASEREIREVKEDEGFGTLITDFSGTTEEFRKKYEETNLEAEIHVREKVYAEALQDLKDEEEKWWKEEREKVKAEIEAQVNEQPIYKALYYLQKGQFPQPSDERPPGFKLSRDLIRQGYSVSHGEVATRVLLEKLPRFATGSKTVHQDIMGSWFGYVNGNEFLRDLANAEPSADLVDRLADEEMKRRHGEPLTEEQLQQEALKHYHNTSEAKLRQMEMEFILEQNLKAVRKAATRGPSVFTIPQLEAVTRQAQEAMKPLLVGQINPTVYQASERKALQKGKGELNRKEWDDAFDSIRRALINGARYRAAVDAQENVAKALKKWKKNFSRSDQSLAKSRDVDLINAGRAILAAYGVGKFEGHPDDYLKQVQQYDPEGYAGLKTEIDHVMRDAKPIDEISYGKFLEVQQSVDSLWELSIRAREFEVEGEKMDIDIARDELIDGMAPFEKKETAERYGRDKTDWDKAKVRMLGLKANLRIVGSWTNTMDLGASNGKFTRYIARKVSIATAQYRDHRTQVYAKFFKIIEKLHGEFGDREIAAPEIGWTFRSMRSLLHAIAHTGNESNKRKLLLGGQGIGAWAELREDGSMDTSKWDAFITRISTGPDAILEKKHYDAVQEIWDLFEELKPDAQRVYRRFWGHYFNEITAEPFETPFGAYRGGYIPAKTDPYLVPEAAIHEDKRALEENDNFSIFPQPGFTHDRIEDYTKPLQLDMKTMVGHLDQVLRFIHIAPATKEVARLVNHRNWRNAMAKVDPEITSEMLIPWLQRASNQRLSKASGRGGRAADNIWRWIRKNSGMQFLVGSVLNAAQQITGLSIALLKVKPRYLKAAAWELIRHPGRVAEMIADRSVYMRTTTASQLADIQNDINDIMLDPGVYGQTKAFTDKHGMVLQRIMQNLVNLITWLGAYNQAVEANHGEPTAVHIADEAVRLTQGEGTPEGQSAYTTGTEFAKLFTMFQTYFNMLANTLGSEFVITMKTAGLKKGAGRLLYVYFFGFMLPAVLAEAIVVAGKGGPDDEDDDGYLDEWLDLLFGSQFRTVTAMIPGGSITRTAVQSFTKDPDRFYDDRISTSPAVSVIEASVKSAGNVYHAIADEESKRSVGSVTRDALTALGFFSGIPTAVVGRPIGYALDVEQGKVEPTGAVDYARGLVTGKR